MSIIISKNGKQAVKIDQANFDKEDYLQNYIHENPESIPVYEIEEDKRLFVAAREFSTEAGPIDALAVDKDGDLYIVETKLYKNPDKRTVVAQALDYGAALWKHVGDFGEFLQALDEKVRGKFQVSFSDKIKEFFSLDDEQAGMLLDAMARNLKDGNLKFVILMDTLDERLKDLIIYVNQNSQFDIFAVQMEYYKFHEYEIMIPKLYGAEVKKSLGSTSSASPRGQWNEQSFFAALDEELDGKTATTVKDAFKKFSDAGDGIIWGTGKRTASFGPKLDALSSTKSLLSVFAKGKLMLKINWFGKDEREDLIRRRFKELWEQNVTKLEIPISLTDSYHFEPQDWLSHRDEIVKAFTKLVEEYG